MDLVYIAMSADVVHQGHINIIKKGSEYGSVIIGLLTDEAIASYKRLPLLSYSDREKIFSEFKGVDKVVPQTTLDYTENLEMYKPKYVIHGDDWKTGVQRNIREKVIAQLSQWGGELIEIPYTDSISCTQLERDTRKRLTTPDIRRGKLKKLLKFRDYVTVCEASNGLSGLIVEETSVTDPETGSLREFDAMWISSLCDSTFKGKPDTELVDLTSRLRTIDEIIEVTSKPIILDGDTGGKVEHFTYNVRTLERLGVSAIIIEDKTGSKKNSLFGTEVEQTLDDPHDFAEKILAGKRSQITDDFMIFARIEALIAGRSVEEALSRAEIYVNEGKADGICIHSKEKDGSEIKDFLSKFKKQFPTIPVIVIPTTYNQFTDEELCGWGADIIIYANHLLRSAYPAMKNTVEMMLEKHRSLEASEKYCIPIKQVLNIIPGER
ncbi:MAG: phosphoenolpyruvate mutase [Thermoplasmata archaeon]|nr:phosphoenolpyruvate mutase [Thermoplasmata archaeon]